MIKNNIKPLLLVFWGLTLILIVRWDNEFTINLAHGAHIDQQLYLPLVSAPSPQPTLEPIVPPSCDNNEWQLQWSLLDDALVSSYTIAQAHTPDFAQATFTETVSLMHTFAPLASPQNQYFYRVRANGSWGAGPWSESRFVLGHFSDNFTNPQSGWPVADTPIGGLSYQDGVFQIEARESRQYISAVAPDLLRDQYRARATMRWADGSSTNGIYALTFGVTPDLTRYYFLAIRPEIQSFRLLEYNSQLPTNQQLRDLTDGWISEPAIVSEYGTNSLEVQWLAGTMTVMINEVVVGAWTDTALLGSSYAGLMVTSNPNDPFAIAWIEQFDVIGCDLASDLTNILPSSLHQIASPVRLFE